MSSRDGDSEREDASAEDTSGNMQGHRIWTLPPLGERDRAHIRCLSPPEVRSWALEKAMRLCHPDPKPYYVARLHALHNSTLPFCRLPPEIFLHILGFLGRGRPDARWALAYTAVCRCWRETLFSYPLLWGTIDLGNKDAFNQFCLLLSKNADLAIRLHDAASRSVRPSAMHTPLFNNLLVPHFHRIARLELEPYSLVSLYRSSKLSMLDGPMERLAVLRLSSMFDIGRPLHLHLNGLHFPRLEILSLDSVSIDWHGFTLPNLVSLTLTTTRDGQARQPTLDALLDFLEAAPLLQTLNLTGLGPTFLPVTSHSSRSPLRLNHLRTFRFLSPSAGCLALLSHLTLPADVCMTILGSPLPIPEDDATVPPNAKTIMSVLPAHMKHTVLSKIRTVHLHIWDEGFTLHADSKHTGYKNRLSTLRVILDSAEGVCDAFLPNSLLELPHIFPSALTSLMVESGGLNLVDRHQWMLLFAAFPHLLILRLCSDTPLSQECFTALRGSGDLPIPCDKLQILDLGCEQGAEEEISDMLDGVQCCLEDRLQAGARLVELQVTAPTLSRRREEYAARLGELVTVLKLSSQFSA